MVLQGIHTLNVFKISVTKIAQLLNIYLLDNIYEYINRLPTLHVRLADKEPYNHD